MANGEYVKRRGDKENIIPAVTVTMTVTDTTTKITTTTVTASMFRWTRQDTWSPEHNHGLGNRNKTRRFDVHACPRNNGTCDNPTDRRLGNELRSCAGRIYRRPICRARAPQGVFSLWRSTAIRTAQPNDSTSALRILHPSLRTVLPVKYIRRRTGIYYVKKEIILIEKKREKKVKGLNFLTRILEGRRDE